MKLLTFIVVFVLLQLTFTYKKLKLNKSNKNTKSPSKPLLLYFSKIAKPANPKNDLKLLDADNWTLIKQVEDKKNNGLGFVLSSRVEELIVVSIRENDLTKWANIKAEFSRKKIPFPTCRLCEVHPFFVNFVTKLQDGLDEGLDIVLNKRKKARLVVTGHSIAGGVAALYAIHVMNKWRNRLLNRMELVTFGSPRIGNHEFAYYINGLLGLENIYRVTFQRDNIPFLPPLKNGYYHMGGSRYTFEGLYDFKIIKEEDKDVKYPWKANSSEDHYNYFKLKVPTRRLRTR